MSERPLVRVRGLSKRFKLYSQPWQRLADWLPLPGAPRYGEFWALRDVSFELAQGECLGIIGPNGAGKSTLLKLLTGTVVPTTGDLEVNGRVLSLLELGTGFNPELTGRANIHQGAALLGVAPGFVREHMVEIEQFAELGDYFDRPVRAYSSGMLVRLAFSMFSAMQPEVFLVDEALAVGDLRFSGKALARIRDMLSRGTTLLLVSHDLRLITNLCSRALWLHAGTVQMDGPPGEVTRAYQQFVVHGRMDRVVEPESRNSAPPEQVEDGVDTALPQPLLYVGAGWYELEAFDGQVFRWGTAEAELVIPRVGPGEQSLLLDLEPGPGMVAGSAHLRILDEQRRILQEISLAARQIVEVPLRPDGRGGARLRLHTVASNVGGANSRSMLSDERALVMRLFQWGWAGDSSLFSVTMLGRWAEHSAKEEILRELESMHAALARCAPTSKSGAHILEVVTRDESGDVSVNFETTAYVRIDVIVEADRQVDQLIVGVQVRDPFDRILCGTRTDWYTFEPLSLDAGERVTQSFIVPRLALGSGRYQITTGLVGRIDETESLWQWVDGAWGMHVAAPADARFGGLIDLGIEALPAMRLAAGRPRK